VDIFDIFGAAFPPPTAIEVKFCTAKRTKVPVGPAKLYVNRCNQSPLRGEKRDFWPVSKFNTGSLPLRGNTAGNKQEAELMLTNLRDAFVGQCHQTWYLSICYI